MQDKTNRNIPTGADTSLIKASAGFVGIKIMMHNVNQQYYNSYGKVKQELLKYIKFCLEKGEISEKEIIEFMNGKENWDIW